MNKDINDLLNVVYEVEGLILLLDKKSDNLPTELVQLLKNKVSFLHSAIDEILNESIVEEFTQNIVESYTTEEILTSSKEGNDDISLGDEQVTELEELLVDEKYEDELTIDYIDNNDDIDILDEDFGVNELNDEFDIETESDSISSEEFDDTITIEEKLVIQSTRDLKQAFTINDRYRFRRELFGNSDIDFIDMINLVSAMSSITEAEEYFYSDLEWDKENEEVKDFMTIIAHYFAN